MRVTDRRRCRTAKVLRVSCGQLSGLLGFGHKDCSCERGYCSSPFFRVKGGLPCCRIAGVSLHRVQMQGQIRSKHIELRASQIRLRVVGGPGCGGTAKEVLVFRPDRAIEQQRGCHDWQSSASRENILSRAEDWSSHLGAPSLSELDLDENPAAVEDGDKEPADGDESERVEKGG